MTEVIEIVLMIVPWLVAIGFCIAFFYVNNKKLPETRQELMEALGKVVEVKDKVEKVLSEVISFFNPEKPMSETSIEVITEVIPANSYQMNDESQALVLSYCTSEEEKQRVLNEISIWENPSKSGEECCVYTLETTGATFKVQYGVPELIYLKENDYEYLSQQKIAEIVETLGNENEFSVLTKIIMNEREHKVEYELETDKGKVLVKNGTYTAL